MVRLSLLLVVFAALGFGQFTTLPASSGGSGGGDSLPSQSGNADKILATDGSSAAWRSLSGDTFIGITPSSGGYAFAFNSSTLFDLAGNNTVTGQIYLPASSTQTISSAGTAITANRRTVAVSCSSALTLTSAPTIANGTDGQVITIVNVGSNNCILQDQDTLASSNLQLASTSVTIPPKGQLTLQYNSTVGDWIQDGVAAGGTTYTADKGVTISGSTISGPVQKCYAPGNSATATGTTTQLGTASLTGLASGGMIRYSLRFSAENGTTATKRFRVSFGGSDVLDENAWSSATTTSGWMVGEIALTGSAEQYNSSLLSVAAASPGGMAAGSGGRSTVTTVDISGGTATLNVYGGVTAGPVGTEQITLRHMCVQYFPPVN